MGQAIKKRLGVLGGTFDPVHLAHVEIARLAIVQAELDSLIFVPCHIPPHRNAAYASDEQRLRMLEIAVSNEPDFSVNDFELNKSSTSYTVETLEHFSKIYKNTELVFCMGGDSLVNLPTWHRWQDILDLAIIAVLDRGDVLDALDTSGLNELGGKILKLDAQDLNVACKNASATLIRQQLAEHSGKNFDAYRQDELLNQWLNKDVLSYIYDNQVYLKA